MGRTDGLRGATRWLFAELVVVALGVLVALWVEGWRQDAEDRATERETLVALSRAFDDNRASLDSRRQNYERRAQAQAILLSVVQARTQVPADSVDALLRWAIRAGTHDAPGGVLAAVFASGELGLIQDRELRSLLGQWPASLDNLREFEDLHNALVVDYLRPLLRSRGLLPSGIGARDMRPPVQAPDHGRLVGDPLVEQILIELAGYGEAVLTVLEGTDALLRDIEARLE